jgi:putative flippase GtrA
VRRLLRAPVGALAEFGAFGVIGGLNAVLEVLLFTALNAGAHLGPMTSKLLSFVVTAVLSYYLNRTWTWRHRRGTGGARDLAQFVAISAGGLLLAEACLATSHYLLGLHSLLADNASANVIGLALGTAWRFWAARRWIFTAADAPTA